MKKDKIIGILKNDRLFLKDNFGVEVISLFGLYAKDIENPESDIDVYVEIKTPSYNFLMGLYSHLKNKLNSKIEIFRKGSHLSDRFMNIIKNDFIFVV